MGKIIDLKDIMDEARQEKLNKLFARFARIETKSTSNDTVEVTIILLEDE